MFTALRFQAVGPGLVTQLEPSRFQRAEDLDLESGDMEVHAIKGQNTGEEGVVCRENLERMQLTNDEY